jgi:hypothetical protein
MRLVDGAVMALLRSEGRVYLFSYLALTLDLVAVSRLEGRLPFFKFLFGADVGPGQKPIWAECAGE